MHKKYVKKGQIQASVGAIITLIVGVGVAVLVLIFVGTLGGQTYNLVETDIDSIGNNSVVNQLGSANNVTAQSLGHADLHVGTFLTNNTGLGEANFTINYDAGTYLLKTGSSSLNGEDLLLNYSWGNAAIKTSIKGGITQGFLALEQTGKYLPIIVLAVVITLVMFLILGFTAIGGTGGGRNTVL